jgi:hypothetical protein
MSCTRVGVTASVEVRVRLGTRAGVRVRATVCGRLGGCIDGLGIGPGVGEGPGAGSGVLAQPVMMKTLASMDAAMKNCILRPICRLAFPRLERSSRESRARCGCAKSATFSVLVTRLFKTRNFSEIERISAEKRSLFEELKATLLGEVKQLVL